MDFFELCNKCGFLIVFAKMNVFAIQCGHDPLFFKKFVQWVMTTLYEITIIVKEP